MADVFDKEKRSEIMRRVKSKNNNTTEVRLIRFFKENHIIGWRRNYQVFGKPDFVFFKRKIAIFVDGCFWHGHDCRNTHPKQNEAYWADKIKRNQKRDAAVTEHLCALGWTVIRIWECELNRKNLPILKSKLDILLNRSI